MPDHDHLVRRPRIGPGEAVGVDEAMIRELVHAGYARVRQDPQLGPIFEDAIGDGWDVHMAKLCDFWSSVMLMTARFKGQPMTVHARLRGVGDTHFARWLELFAETTATTCPPDAAALFQEKAAVIARSLKLGIAVSRGEIPRLGGR
jgi:hemoglobin